MTIDQIKARKEREDKQKQINLAYKRVFATPDGQTVLEDIEAMFGIWLPAFIQPPSTLWDVDTYGKIRDGQRQVWLHIRHRLRAKVEPDGNEADPRVTVRTGLSENGS